MNIYILNFKTFLPSAVNIFGYTSKKIRSEQQVMYI